MSNNLPLTTNVADASGGARLTALDIGNFTSYPSDGLTLATVLYVQSGTAAAPTAVSLQNPVPVQLQSGSAVIGTTSQVLSGSVQVSGAVIVSGNVGVSGSVQLLSGSAWMGVVEGIFNPVATGPTSGQPWPVQVDGSGRLITVTDVAVTVAGSQVSGAVRVSGAVQVSGIVGVSGSVAILSGRVSVSSGLVGILSGNVGVSGSVQLLSGSVPIGIIEGVFSPVAVGPTSGQPWPIQIDGSGNQLVAIVGSISTTSSVVSGSVVVSGIVGISGSVGILSGQVSVSSGSVGAQVSGAVVVSGNVSVSGSVQSLSGSAFIGVTEGIFSPVAVGPASGQAFPIQIDGSGNQTVSVVGPVTVPVTSGSVQVSGIVGISGQVGILSGLIGVLSGSVGAQVSGAVVVSGNVGVSGSVQLLSGSAAIGIVEGIFSPVAVGPVSGQPYPVQIDGSGNLKASIVGTPVTSGSVLVSGIVGVSGSVNILSGQVSISSGLVGVLSGSMGAQVSGAVIVSGIVGVSGAVQVLSGSITLGSGASTVGSLASGNNIIAAPFADLSILSQNLSLTIDNTQNVALSVHGCGSAAIQITGTWTGLLIFEGTVDGTNWFAISGNAIAGNGNSVTSIVSSSNAFFVGCNGLSQIRVRVNTTGTGTAVVSIKASASSTAVSLDLPLPFGGNSIGNVQLLSGSATIGNVQGVPTNSGGWAIKRLFSGLQLGAASGQAIQIQSGAGQLCSLGWKNKGFSGLFLKLYDQTSGPIVGTATPFLTVPIGQNENSNPLLQSLTGGLIGVQYNQGLWVAATGAMEDSDTSSISGLSGLVYAWFTFRSGF